jgi:endonuclease YncB( thermonuclease family)
MPRDPWSAFPDAGSEDPWAEYPDAETKPRKPVKVRSAVNPPSLEGAQAVDGDTLRAGDSRVRIWGIDAPEVRQPGYDRQGQPVPIGRQSRDWLQGEIVQTGVPRLRSAVGTSFGRTVGPVALGETDAGLASVRLGNALAAPSPASMAWGR